MGWDQVSFGGRFHFFRTLKGKDHKQSLCGTVKAPVSKDIPGSLVVFPEMCKRCLRLHGKKKWGDKYVS